MPKLKNGPKNDSQYLFIKDGVYKKNSIEKKYGEIASEYPYLPVTWKTGIDAAFYNRFQNKIYLFKGLQYLRFTPAIRI